MNVPERPSGLDEIVKTFGNVRAYVRPDGTLSPDWERHELGIANLPAPLPLGWDLEREVSRIRCHQKLVALFEATFFSIHHLGLWPLLKTFDGCFAWRPQRGSSRISTHAWGISIDINAGSNQLGTAGDMSLQLIRAFEGQGFFWGGRFGRPDPMHFQFADSY